MSKKSPVCRFSPVVRRPLRSINTCEPMHRCIRQHNAKLYHIGGGRRLMGQPSPSRRILWGLRVPASHVRGRETAHRLWVQHRGASVARPPGGGHPTDQRRNAGRDGESKRRRRLAACQWEPLEQGCTGERGRSGRGFAVGGGRRSRQLPSRCAACHSAGGTESKKQDHHSRCSWA